MDLIQKRSKYTPSSNLVLRGRAIVSTLFASTKNVLGNGLYLAQKGLYLLCRRCNKQKGNFRMANGVIHSIPLEQNVLLSRSRLALPHCLLLVGLTSHITRVIVISISRNPPTTFQTFGFAKLINNSPCDGQILSYSESLPSISIKQHILSFFM